VLIPASAVPHDEDCVFRICPRNKYDAHTALNDQLDAVSRTRASIGSRQFDPDPEAVHLEKKLLQLKVLPVPCLSSLDELVK
jgi:hypothetical protein